MAEKSRHIPISDYFSILQLEYISYKLREISYQKKYAEKYKGYCRGKKEKIDSIATRNCIPSIFTSETMREKYMTQFFNEWGLPNFTYKDKASETMMGRWDKYYYFAKGTSVKFKDQDDSVLTGVIQENNVEEGIAVVSYMGDNTIELEYSKISRIIAEGFINF